MLAVLTLLFGGCGGSGSGESASTGSGNGTGVQMFVTDDLSTSYSHVWVTVLGVTLTNSSGSVSAYSSTTGQQIDVAALHSSGVASVFAFLANASVPSGTYTGATLTLAKTVTLVPVGSTTSITKTFNSLDSAGDKEVTINFGPNTVVSNGSSLVFDFNLSKWTEDSSSINCVVQSGPTTGLNSPGNQVSTSHTGTISQLTGTAPAQTFLLTTDDGYTIKVSSSSSTTFSNSDGSSNPVLANGQSVVVQGIFSVSSNAFVASSVVIEVGQSNSEQPPVFAGGTLGSYSAGSTTFTVSVSQAFRFIPSGTTETIATTSTTKFFGFRGESLDSAEFFALLPTATYVNVEGSYDSSTSTITATGIHLAGTPSTDPNGVTVRGTPGSGATATSLSLTVTQEDGLALTLGSTVSVVPATNVVYEDATGATVNAATFTTDLATAASVSAFGDYNANSTTLTATRLRIWSSSTGWNNVQLVGTAASFSSDGSFTLTLTGWRDCQLSNGQSINVTVSSSTTYSLTSGSTTQSAFETAEANKPIVVTGALNSDGTLTATSVAAVRSPG